MREGGEAGEGGQKRVDGWTDGVGRERAGERGKDEEGERMEGEEDGVRLVSSWEIPTRIKDKMVRVVLSVGSHLPAAHKRATRALLIFQELL